MSMENKSELQHKKMTETPIAQLLVSLSIPTVISMLITSVYNMADTYFVTKIGESAVGAVGITYSIQSVIQAVGFTLAMGSASLASLNLGKKDDKTANKYASSAFWISFALGLLIMLGCSINLEGLLRLIGATNTILFYAKSYAQIILIGAPIMCATFVANQLLRSEGKSKFSMVAMMTGGLLNILLDPLFIFTFNLGVSGAAIATVLSQCVSFLIMISFYLTKKSVVRLSIKYASRNIQDYIKIFQVGLPTLFRQGLASIATTLLNIQISAYGDAAVAAISIVNKFYMIIRSIVLGVGQGFQPIAGYNYGAKKIFRVRKAFFTATIFGSLVSCIGAIVTLLFSSDVMIFFADGNPQVVQIGRQALLMLSAALPFLGYSTYVNMMYQSLGFVKGATFLASCRQGIFFIPLIFALPLLFEINGVLLAQPVSELLTFLISIPFNIVFMKKVLNASLNE